MASEPRNQTGPASNLQSELSVETAHASTRAVQLLDPARVQAGHHSLAEVTVVKLARVGAGIGIFIISGNCTDKLLHDVLVQLSLTSWSSSTLRDRSLRHAYRNPANCLA